MSLFGSIMGDFDDDIFGNPMQAMNMHMRSMNRMMNSLMPDPFNMLAPFDAGRDAIMERNPAAAGQMNLFGFPAMPNINRLLNADIGSPNGASYCSSSVITMSSGPDGRPQIYQATSSTKTGPGGIRETRKTVQDSTRGIKKMAIGHHIGDRAHIIEKEQDIGSGQLEERQEFINLDEEHAEDFDREFTTRARMSARGAIGAAAGHVDPRPQRQVLSIEPVEDYEDEQQQQYNSHQRRQLPALPPPPSSATAHHHYQQQQQNSSSKAATATVSDATKGSDSKSSKVSATASSNSKNKSSASSNEANGGNNNYVSRAAALRAYRNQLAGASPRRPLRTPPSSPLTTTPASHSASANTLSIHPHPYNAAAARRNYRSKHTKQHQEPHAAVIIDDDDYNSKPSKSPKA